MFCASIIPALALGQQISELTDGSFNVVNVLLPTAIAGIIFSLIGGQPLLVWGVAEPIVLCYGFMYDFAKNQGFQQAFVPWCTWTLIWAAVFIFILSLSGAQLGPVAQRDNVATDTQLANVDDHSTRNGRRVATYDTHRQTGIQRLAFVLCTAA